MTIRGATVVVVVGVAAALLGLPATGSAEPAGSHQCDSGVSTPSEIKKLVISSPDHRDRVRLGLGHGLRVVAHDKSAYGVGRAWLAQDSTAVCWLRRGGSEHRKWVLLVAMHVGRSQIAWAPRVAPGTGAATEIVKLRVR